MGRRAIRAPDPSERLAATAGWCRDRLAKGTPVDADFNNDIGGHATRDAVRFRALVGV